MGSWQKNQQFVLEVLDILRCRGSMSLPLLSAGAETDAAAAWPLPRLLPAAHLQDHDLSLSDHLLEPHC